MMRVLNLYAGIGGNRKFWDDVDVTAIEMDEETAKVYQDYFPNDKVIIADAHEFLLKHFNEYDFIWSSPPCPSHSKINNFAYNIKEGMGKREYEYPDIKLYEEIIFLKKWFKGKFVVENVIPYYPPLIPAEEVDRHLFWANFKIGRFEPMNKKRIHKKATKKDLEKLFGYELSEYKLDNPRKRLRNCVHPEVGEHIMKRAKGINQSRNTTQKPCLYNVSALKLAQKEQFITFNVAKNVPKAKP